MTFDGSTRNCIDALMVAANLLYWSLPVVVWISPRKNIPGSKVSLGELLLGVWVLTLAAAILAFGTGYGYREGSPEEGTCSLLIAFSGILVCMYVLLMLPVRDDHKK